MATKNDKTDSAPTPAPRTRATFRERPAPPVFASQQDERAWFAEQDRLEREASEARAKYPPGTRLFVTTARGLPRRGRAGLTFTDKGRTEVEVVDMTDDELAKIRTLSQEQIERLHKGQEVEGVDVDGPTAARVRSGAGYVTPTGAKAIAEDMGLVTFTENAPSSSGASPSELDSRIADLEAENKSLREQLASSRRGSNVGAGGPERLAGKAGKAGETSSEFGGDEGKKG